MTDEEGRRQIAAELVRDADASDRGATEEIGSGFEKFEEYAVVENRYRWNDGGLGAAYTFWSRWIDARNHQWQHYPKMQQPSDWAVVARRVAAALLTGDDPSLLVQERTA
jgi:hypothetical protein